MQTIRDIGQLRDSLAALRAGGHSVALVPTMGALHAGHLALVEEAKRQAERVVATIFVNPLQFGEGEDLDRYPRREEEDALALAKAGCDLLWIPMAGQMYPPGFCTAVSVAGLGQRWEGDARPGHFDGVATVVTKLLDAVRPEVAVFGEKDFQQLAIIRRLAIDLNLGTAIVGVPIVRDCDGLALSSRNIYLSKDERARATVLPNALHAAAEAIEGGQPVNAAIEQARRALDDAGFAPIDYVALIDEATLDPLQSPVGRMRLIAAATMGSTRLIDNVPVAGRQQG